MPIGKYCMKEVSKMDKELKQALEWINENLKAIVMNQNLMYCRIQDIEDGLKEKFPQRHELK
jgi:hypothetical protein